MFTSLLRRVLGGNRVLQKLRAWKHAANALRAIGLNPWKPNVIFDVGANDGTSFSAVAREIPWLTVYAFEPTPQLLSDLTARMSGIRNYHIVANAVGEKVGPISFNVAGQGDWGCSSVLDFSSGLENTWPGRTDFHVTERITVDMIRLDAFVRSHRITKIDFLHIDTQGTDLSVLKSLGDEICRVVSGVIEVPQSLEVMLYKGQHTREQALAWLDANGFVIWKTIRQQNEDNLFFRRRAK